MSVEDLNSKFGIKGHASVVAGKGGLATVMVKNAAASAEITLMGGSILSYIPNGSKECIWVSPDSLYEKGKAIRGGVPVCWPWFGKNMENPDAPMHGIARLLDWTLVGIVANAPDSTTVKLILRDSEETRKFWDYTFTLELTVTVGATLDISLKTTNNDIKPFLLSQALHTYFNVGDITKVTVEGFDGLRFLNKVGEPAYGRRKGTFVIDQEVDEVYQDCSGTAIIRDASMNRSIQIAKENSDSAVVWNPWIEKSKRLDDFPDDGYKTMLCVETTNALADARIIKPGESIDLIAKISLI